MFTLVPGVFVGKKVGWRGCLVPRELGGKSGGSLGVHTSRSLPSPVLDNHPKASNWASTGINSNTHPRKLAADPKDLYNPPRASHSNSASRLSHIYLLEHPPSVSSSNMDFASILGAEISKNKKRKTASSDDNSTPSSSAPKKYLKRSEIEAQRQRDYLAEQARLESERAAKAAEKRRREEEAAAEVERQKQKRLELAEARRARQVALNPDAAAGEEGRDGKEDEKVEGGEEITNEEAVRRLRELGEPTRLFGETDQGRVKRLRRIEKRKAAEAVIALPELPEEEMMLDLADVERDPVKIYRQLDSWFKLVLREWKRALHNRPDSVKESLQGRKAADAMRQADEYMKPLFEHFKKRDLGEVVYEKVCEIVHEAQMRRYVKANDIYLRLSIGNA